MLAGIEAPEAGCGQVKIGDTVSLGLVSQSRANLDPEKTVFEEVGEGEETLRFGAQVVPVRQYIASFALKGPAQGKKVGVLSGGERNRVHLAKVLKGGHNLLLLDEPTNDLDVHTLRALEEALLSFAGTAVVISHDRWFLDRICTHTLAFEEVAEGAEGAEDATSRVEFYPGSFSEYREFLAREARNNKGGGGDAASAPGGNSTTGGKGKGKKNKKKSKAR
mmetsp:Transcript_9384/g.21245  ORF Transcript_9384/g.21245 Transcript_9384/m.21245 type:complete len:221 (-) Transcript_9384:218-880(-)